MAFIGAHRRVLAAVMFSDVVGYTSRVHEDESRALALVKRDLDILNRRCREHRGRVIKNTGDGLLMHFTTAGDAMGCALKAQSDFARLARELPAESVLEHRVAIHLAEIRVTDHDILGDGVNVAARLLDHAKPSGIAFSQVVYETVKHRLRVKPAFLGRKSLHNLPDKMPVYHILVPAAMNQKPNGPGVLDEATEGLRGRMFGAIFPILKGQGIMGKAIYAALLLSLALVLALAVRDNLADAPRAGQVGPVPSVAQQQKAERTIKSVFKEEYAARSADDRKSLAKKLLDQGVRNQSDAVAKYVSLREAKDLAAGAGDLSTAMAAIEQLAASFEVDALDMRATSLVTAAPLLPAAEAANAVELGLGLMNDAAAADRFPIATRVGPVVESLASRTKDLPLVSKVQARNREIADQRREYDRYRTAMETLAKKPEDAEANAIAGKYLCLTKGQWDTGLPLLAKGNDAALRDLAKAELAKPTDAAAQVKLADGWWEASTASTDPARSSAQKHSIQWYVSALPRVTGGERDRITARAKLYSPDLPAPVAVVATTSPAPVTGMRGTATVRLLHTVQSSGLDRPESKALFTDAGKLLYRRNPSDELAVWDVTTGAKISAQQKGRVVGDTSMSNHFGKILDLRTGQALGHLDIGAGTTDSTVDGSRIVVGSTSSGPTKAQHVIADVPNRRILHRIDGYRWSNFISVTSDGKRTFLCSKDLITAVQTETAAEVWQVKLRDLYSDATEIKGFTLGSDGAVLIAEIVAGNQRQPLCLDATTGKRLPLNLPKPPLIFDWSADRRSILCATPDKLQLQKVVEGGKDGPAFGAFNAPITRIDYAPNGRWAILTLKGEASEFWDIVEQRRIATAPPAKVKTCSFSRDGNLAARVLEDEQIQIWRFEEAPAKPTQTLP